MKPTGKEERRYLTGRRMIHLRRRHAFNIQTKCLRAGAKPPVWMGWLNPQGLFIIIIISIVYICQLKNIEFLDLVLTNNEKPLENIYK